MPNKLEDLMNMQGAFSDKFYDIDYLSNLEKQEILKTLCLSLHAEVSNISLSTNFREYDLEKNSKINKDNLIYHTVDAMRYLFAILNLYEINPISFVDAFIEKDTTLNMSLELRKPNKDQKVVIVDIDDVLCSFRENFNGWLYKTYNILVDKNSTSYYSSKEVLEAGYSPELVFEEFINDNQFLEIDVIPEAMIMLNSLKEKGYYIQLLTSRPEGNLKCKYQTFQWLKNNNITFDNIGFAPEKYLWLAKKDYYVQGNVVFAIDDSAKHAMEYATHNIQCYVPKTKYNENIQHENIQHFVYNELEKLLCKF